MSQKLPNLLIIALVGAAVIVLISLGLESVINNLDDMLVPCQHGTSYNKATASCNCMNTPFTGKYCGECDCAHGQCMVGGTTPKAGSLYGCRCPIGTKRFGHKCQLCYAENTTSCKGPCQNRFYGAVCDKTCNSNLVQSDLFASTLTADAAVCRNIQDNGGTCNYCSGHGLCGATGNCDCEKNYFNGPNGGCSQTCAIADNGKICSGHGVCEKIAGVPTCACEYGWRGTDCSVPCPGMEVNGVPCSNHGQCLVNYTGTPTTSCNCNQKFRGDACEIECPGEIVACSGHGTCDNVGVCACNSPAGGVTWVGEACSCSDFITCSGNGNCMGNAQCQCIGNWGGEHCRQCKENYYGSNCQFYCDSDGNPSASGIGCYGRGTCTVLDFAKRQERVICECFGEIKVFDDGKITTHFSNYEPSDNCLDCAAGYVPKITTVDQYGLPDGVKVPCELYCSTQTCNNLGDCNEDWGITGETLCHCSHGPDNKKHLDDENFCLSCETGWFPEDIHSDHGCSNFCTPDIADAPYSGTFPAICTTGVVDCVQCSGHGTCGPRGECLCEDGYTGVECNIQCTGSNGLTCSGHGECKVNQLQELMQFEYEYVGDSGALYSCECNPQDAYTDEERKDFRIRVANGEVNGTLEDPPVKTFYGEMCEYNCKTPPWAQSEVCNGFGDCEINKIQDPNGGHATCTSDNDCTTNFAIQAILSGSSDWSAEKGPFCHKADSPPGCTTSNFANEDCYYILALQRPVKARGKECMRDDTCRNFLDGTDWHGWCNDIQTAQKPLPVCESDWETYCSLIKDSQNISPSCVSYVEEAGTTILDFSHVNNDHYVYNGENDPEIKLCVNQKYRFTRVDAGHTLRVVKDSDCTGCETGTYTSLPTSTVSGWTDSTYGSPSDISFSDPGVYYYVCDAHPNMVGKLTVSNVDCPSTYTVTHELNYCYEKDKSRFPFKVTEAYRGDTAVELHDTIAETFEQFTIKYSNLDMDATQFCDNYLKMFEVEVSHIRTDQLYICNNRIQHTDNCSTEALSLDTVWKPFYVDCDGRQTQYTTLEEAIDNRHEGCIVVEEVVDVDNVTLSNLFAVKSQMGENCVDNADCASNECYEGTCCASGTNTTNCEKCNNQGTCDCLPGSIKQISKCIYDNSSCTGVSYWLDNVGCVNQVVGEACFKDAGCQSEVCIGGTCASQESPNCAQVNAAGACIQCIADATLTGTTCTPNSCPSGKMFVTDEGCVDRPSDALEQQVQNLLEKTCSNAESIFPMCQLPTDACNVNGISACNDGDSCHTFEGDAICSTLGVLNATCKFGLEVVPLSFSTYKCIGNFTLVNRDVCLEAARDMNWFSYCKGSNAVLFHDNFGANAIQENEQPAAIYLEQDQRDGDLFSFWVKTNSVIRSSASISVKSGSHEIFRVFLHQGQIQLNAIDTLQSCPVDQPTCNDDFMYNINEWLNLKVSIHYSLTSSSVTLHYNGNTKTDGFLCSGCGAVTDISAIYIEPGSADTYYDEIIFSKSIAPPPVVSACSNYILCDFDVDYRDKCIDLLTNVIYPTTVEPQHNIIDVCEHRKEQKKFVGITTTIEILQGMDALNWTGYCKFKEELNEPIECGALTYNLLEDYPTECDPWIRPIDTTKACVLSNLRVNWQTQCTAIDDAFVTSDMKTYCDPSCYEHFINYDQCAVRDTIFSSNSEIPLSVSGCNNVNWLNWCNDVAKNTHPGICSAVECDCSKQVGMTGDSCDLFCNIAADGSPCGIDSGVGICRYTKEQEEQLAQGPFPNELIELIGECECFASEGTSNCDQPCAACVNTTYSYVAAPETLQFSASGTNHFVYDNEDDPEITVCSNTPITFERTTSGHPLRVVSTSDCTECYTGSWFSLPTTSVGGWTDVSHNAPATVTFTETGVFYYLCTVHPNMVGTINVRTCGGQIGQCDAARGLCQCLPPWTIEKHVEYETWKGDIRRKLERVYELPTSLLNVQPGNEHYDKAQEDIFRIRLMQGREAFTRYYLDTSTTGENWTTVHDSWKADPSQYQCSGKPCDFHDTVLLGNLHDSSFNYNYDCSKECPEVSETKIPCSGHGRCAITGSCVCDPAKVIRGTDAATGSSFQINIFGGEKIENSEFMVSKLDQTGYRGENCNLTCPGYHPERQDMTEVCSGHGVCNLESQCQCDIGYTGEICQFTCPGFNEGDLNICAGHGTCGMSQVQIYRDIFAEFNETFYINGVAATRITNEQPDCPLPASKSVGLGYSVINDIGFLDLTKIYMLRETSLCASPSVEPCKKWKDYQSLYYLNRHPFTIDDYTKPTGCILDGNTVMFNDRTTDVTCENGCLCEGVDEVPGVISIHDYMGKEGITFGYEPLTEWDGFIFTESGTPTTNSSMQMREYECYFYADKVLLQPYIEVQSGLPSMEVTREECQRYVAENYGSSMYEDADDNTIAKGCVTIMNGNVVQKVVYNTECVLCASVACSSPNRCVEKSYERIDDSARPTGCLKSGDDIKFNDAATSVSCGTSNMCIEKDIKQVDPVVIYHKQIGFNYSENVGRYQTGDLIWTGNYLLGGEKEYVSNIIAGPANESVIIDICDNDPDCGGYYALIPDTPGTYMAVSKFNNALVEDRTEAYRLVGFETECTGELNKVIHEKTIGKPDRNKGSVTEPECRLIAQRAGKQYLTDFYSGDPTGCFLFTDGKIYFNQQSTTHECSLNKICYETITRRKRDIGDEFYEVDFGTPDGSASQEDCARYAAIKGVALTLADTTGNPGGCYAQGTTIYYNTNTESSQPCGVYSQSMCVKKRSVFFTPFTPVNKDVDLNSCAEVCRVTGQCAFYTVESNVCYMYDGCTELSTGTDEIYQLQSPEDGRVFTHMTKLPPTLCMSENGARFDDKTQAPVIRTINILTANCTGGQIWSAFAGKCVEFSYNPRFDATFFLDKGTTQEKQLPVQCQVTGNNTARCALCTCFSDFIYGQWAGFTCDTCNVGFGNSQCRQICPGFDGDNLQSMCGGNGACLFGSEVNAENGERLFQQANCVCGQDNQYAERQPEAEIYSTYPTTGGLAGDGSIVGYYYFTPVPYTINYPSRFDAQNACNRFNDLDNIDRGGFCFGVYRKYISVEAVSPDVFLAMGFVGGSYTLYGKYWEKQAISGFSRFYNFKRLELYNALEGLPVAKDCKDILSIRSEGFDTCNHFATEDIDPSCTTCEEGWTGKNCRTVCSKCLLGGGCAGVPSESTSSACVCPAGAGALWEHQCCPTGFMVADKTTWQGKSQSDVNAIRLSLTYDSSTTNELDAAYYCKTCPGISHEDWMSPDALYKVCSGPTRGTCQPVPGKLELACDCKMNSVTKNRWLGRACACDESINIPYSTDSMTAESTDYGCMLPTNGNGMCPSGSTVNLFFNPPKIYGQDATYIVGETYGSPFLGVFAGQTFAIRRIVCSVSSPCHTGEGHCENDDQCAGTLKCFIRNDGEEKLSFNAEKITYDMNYCYHEDETMVGCHPTDFENYLNTREYHKQFYYDSANAEFKLPALGEYVPYSQDANLAMVIHQQAFTCPKGRYGLTVPDRVSYGNGRSGATGGSQVQVYSGSSDNPGAPEDQLERCFEACLNQRSPISGTWDFIAKSFDIEDTGACYCNDASQATGGVSSSSTYWTYDVITEGEWNVCEKCQPGKFQSTTGNVGWVKTYSGYNANSISKEECRTYADWHGHEWAGDTYYSCGYPPGCWLWNSKMYFNTCAGTGNCNGWTELKFCLQHGGGLGLAKTDKHPNCENCPSGKFGGPIGSWEAGLCEVCEPGTKQNAAGTGCDDCPAGKYELGGLCLQCPNGQFSPQKHPGSVEQPCISCPAGKDTNGQIETPGTSDAVCRFCPAGKANGVAGTDCVDCGVGKFTSTTGKTSCDNCAIQKFAHVPGMTACKTCGVDSPYSGLYGHVANRDSCVQCNLGEYVSTTTGVCTDCAKGYEQPLNNYQTSCKICDAGEYAPNVGTTTCTKCELGKYQGQAGKDKCEPCGPGTHADVRELSVCKECAVGRKAPNNQMTSCEACPKGQFQPSVKQSSCIACPVHKYAAQLGQTICTPCSAGKNGDPNRAQTASSHCVACGVGKYSTGTGGGCENCAAGRFASGTGTGGNCPACPDGHYNTGTGNTGCTAGCQAKEGTTACYGQTCACYRNRGVSSGTCGSFLDYSLYDVKSECTQSCIAKYCYNDGGPCGTVWDSCAQYAVSCSSSTQWTSGQYMFTSTPLCPAGISGGCCKYAEVCVGCGCEYKFAWWYEWQGRWCTGGGVNYNDCGAAQYCFWGCCKSDGTDAGTQTNCASYCPKSQGHCFNYQNFNHYWNWADC
jgi:plastocyanin